MVNRVDKLAYLDGTRGIAAFLVFLAHFLLAFYSSYFTFDPGASHLQGLEIRYGQSPLSVITNGRFYVCIFFVLSGLVLSTKYFQTNAMEVVVSGAQRRFLRLYIPVAATMIIAYVCMKTGLFYNVPVSKITHSEWWLGSFWTFPDPLAKLLYCMKAGTMLLGDSSFNTTLWTMSVELIGSFFVFAFLALTHNVKNRVASLVLVFLFCKFTENPLLAAFVFGISLNYAASVTARWNKYLISLAVIAFLTLGLLFGSYPASDHYEQTVFAKAPGWFIQNRSWFHVVGAYFVVLACVLSVFLQRVLSLRVFRFLGHISFSLYLLHPLVIGSFGCYLFLQLYTTVNYHTAVMIVFISTACVCIFLSWLMTKYIDDPGIRFSKYVYNRWVKKDVPADGQNIAK